MSSDHVSTPVPDAGPAALAVGRSTARYLHAIAALKGGHVSTGDLGDRLGVSAASVSEKVAKLDREGLVVHEPYRGVTLSDRGAALADRIARRRCLVVSFFEAVVDTALDDRTALAVAVALPEEAIQRLREICSPRCEDPCPDVDRGTDRCTA